MIKKFYFISFHFIPFTMDTINVDRMRSLCSGDRLNVREELLKRYHGRDSELLSNKESYLKYLDNELIKNLESINDGTFFVGLPDYSQLDNLMFIDIPLEDI